jgi:hypothetical protein
MNTYLSDVFDLDQPEWSYDAVVPDILRTTKLPLPAGAKVSGKYSKPRHKASYWEKRLGDQDFEQEDRLDADRYNKLLWEGLMGRPYPRSLKR